MIGIVELTILLWERKYSSGTLDRERSGCLGTLGHRLVRCLLKFSCMMVVHAIDTWTISGSVVTGVINQQNWLTMRTPLGP